MGGRRPGVFQYHSRLLYLSFREISRACGRAPVCIRTLVSIIPHRGLDRYSPIPLTTNCATSQTPSVDGKSQHQLWFFRPYGQQEEENTTPVGAALARPQTTHSTAYHFASPHTIHPIVTARLLCCPTWQCCRTRTQTLGTRAADRHSAQDHNSYPVCPAVASHPWFLAQKPVASKEPCTLTAGPIILAPSCLQTPRIRMSLRLPHPSARLANAHLQ